MLADGVELLLVDDGSTDGTGEEFDRWAEELPGARALHRGHSTGIGDAQEAAIVAASGEFVWLIDCDDRFSPDAVEVLRSTARRTNADVVVARAVNIDTSGSETYRIDARRGPGLLTATEALEQMLDGDIEGYTWTKLYRRSLFDDAAFDDDAAPPPIRTQSDFCLTATAIARSAAVAIIDDVIYSYVRHGSSTMDDRDPPLENLVVAHDHLLRLADRMLADDRTTRRRRARFTVWYLAASAIQWAFYVRASKPALRTARAIARRAMTGVRVRDVLAVDRTVGFEAALLRIHPALYQAVFGLTHRPTAP